MARVLHLKPHAFADIDRNAEWLTRHVSVESAARWTEMIEDRLRDLIANAETYPEADEAKKLGLDLRVRLAGKRPHVYRILFTYTLKPWSFTASDMSAQDELRQDDV